MCSHHSWDLQQDLLSSKFELFFGMFPSLSWDFPLDVPHSLPRKSAYPLVGATWPPFSVSTILPLETMMSSAAARTRLELTGVPANHGARTYFWIWASRLFFNTGGHPRRAVMSLEWSLLARTVTFCPVASIYEQYSQYYLLAPFRSASLLKLFH